MFRDARMARERPEWIPNDVWTRLLEHWNSPSYQSKYIAAKKNRAFETGGTLHTGGSITTYEHALRMVKTLIVCICHIWTTFLKFKIKSNLTL